MEEVEEASYPFIPLFSLHSFPFAETIVVFFVRFSDLCSLKYLRHEEERGSSCLCFLCGVLPPLVVIVIIIGAQ